MPGEERGPARPSASPGAAGPSSSPGPARPLAPPGAPPAADNHRRRKEPSLVTEAARRIPLAGSADIVKARQAGREMAARLRFSPGELTGIATAISEVARNVIEHAKRGEIVLKLEVRRGRRSLVVTARDRGPGIADVAQALRVGYSTGRGLGLGLPGARRLVDELDISSTPGQGTVVTLRKWEP